MCELYTLRAHFLTFSYSSSSVVHQFGVKHKSSKVEIMKFASVDEQYRKFPEIKKDDVKKVLDWVSKQPHLPKITGERA